MFLFLLYWTTKSYIIWYFLLTHNDSLILDMFYIKLSCISFSQICQICGILIIFCHNFLIQSKKSINFGYDQQHIAQNIKFLLPQHRGHWKTDKYLGSEDFDEVDLDSDVNSLASGNLSQSTTVLSQCEQLPWTWMWRLLYFDCW